MKMKLKRVLDRVLKNIAVVENIKQSGMSRRQFIVGKCFQKYMVRRQNARLSEKPNEKI